MIKKLRSFMRELMSREKAFTLVELLIVIAIIAILTVAFLPGALQAPAKARDAGRQKAIRDIQAAAESYIAENNGTIPASNAANNCFISGIVLASNFNPLPMDPKPQTVAGDTSCNSSVVSAGSSTASSNKYFYRAYGTLFYAVGARMELRASGNTSATYTALNNYTANAAGLTNIRNATAISGGGTATTAPTPDITNPFFIMIGPR